ncbi:MAG: hypothetical protein ORN24_06925 [Burkholderiales bacterium]|jgi:hypothetical protein|nr:hypothetical protein [Burkholderiales bacterium]
MNTINHLAEPVKPIKPTTQSGIDRYLNQPQAKQLEFSMGGNLYLYVTTIGSCIFKYRCNFKDRLTYIPIFLGIMILQFSKINFCSFVSSVVII